MNEDFPVSEAVTAEFPVVVIDEPSMVLGVVTLGLVALLALAAAGGLLWLLLALFGWLLHLALLVAIGAVAVVGGLLILVAVLIAAALT